MLNKNKIKEKIILFDLRVKLKKILYYTKRIKTKNRNKKKDQI
jgi:hypothetical protein